MKTCGIMNLRKEEMYLFVNIFKIKHRIMNI